MTLYHSVAVVGSRTFLLQVITLPCRLLSTDF